MLIIITYDVKTDNADGRRRLRLLSKACMDVGQRVQNSVFECNVDAAQLKILERKLLSVVNLDEDSLRIYNLGNNYQHRVVHHGVKPALDLEAPLVL